MSGGSHLGEPLDTEIADIENSSAYPPSIQAGIPKLGLTPKGWTRFSLGELLHRVERPAKLVDAETYQLVTAKRNRGGIVARETLRGDQIRTKTQFYVETGDFLVSNRQISHGACGIVPAGLHRAVVSNEYTAFLTSDALDPRFLNALSHSVYFQQTCFHSSVGVHVEKLVFRLEDWLDWEFDIPPLPEQQRIVAVLDAWDRAIDQSERLIAAKEGLHHSHVAALIPKTADGGSNQWRMRALGELGRVVNGGTPASDEAEYWDGDIPWVTPSEVSQLKSPLVGTTERRISRAGLKNSSAELLPIGSLIVCTRATVGACCINSVPMATNQGFKSLVPKAGTEIRYVYHAVNARQKELVRLANGSTFLEVTKPDFETLRIAVPSPEQQKLIADALDAEAMEITLLGQRLERLEAQKRGLMQRLLTGEWRLDERFGGQPVAPCAALVGGAA